MAFLRLGVVVVGVCAVVVATAGGAVRKTQLTTTVEAGAVASITVNAIPKARCTIVVGHGTAVVTPSGLAPRSGGTITWRWRIRESAAEGRSPVVVDCGNAGRLKSWIRIVPRVHDLSVADAVNVVCARAPRQAMLQFGTEIVPVFPGACTFRVNLASAPDLAAFYSLSITPGSARCSFVVWAQLNVPDDRKLPSTYRGPLGEMHVETCESLRLSPG